MAIPTKKSRKIVVEGVEYCWACSEDWTPRADREDSDFALTVSVVIEVAGQENSRLIGRANFPATIMAGDCWESGVVVQPRHVAALIKMACDAGWNTTSKEYRDDYLRDIILNDPQCGSF